MGLSEQFGILRYAGNITGSDDVQPGRLLGHDEVGRPYEVVDAEYDPAADKTAVQIQYATVEALKAHQERVGAVS